MADLKLFLSALFIPQAYGNKPELLGKFWSAFNKASDALLAGNKIPLKLFAHALAKCGRVDIIQTLGLHTVPDIAGYESQTLSPLPQRTDYHTFVTGVMEDTPRIAQEDPLTVRPGMPPGPPASGSSTKTSSPKIVFKVNTTQGAVRPQNNNGGPHALTPDSKNFCHYVFKKPPNFTTVKYLKRMVVRDCAIMQSPIFFHLDQSYFDRLKDDHRVRVFVAVIKQHKLPDNEKKTHSLSVSLPRNFTTYINGTTIYQEVCWCFIYLKRYMILNNNRPNSMASADLSFLMKNSSNSIKFSWLTSPNSTGYILVSVELVRILTVDERVDFIIKKGTPEKSSKSRGSLIF